jgi:hypothetical protein
MVRRGRPAAACFSRRLFVVRSGAKERAGASQPRGGTASLTLRCRTSVPVLQHRPCSPPEITGNRVALLREIVPDSGG